MLSTIGVYCGRILFSHFEGWQAEPFVLGSQCGKVFPNIGTFLKLIRKSADHFPGAGVAT